MCCVFNNTTGLRKLLRFPVTFSKPRPCMLYMCMLLLSCGDIETHPGPSCYPCAYCQLNVDWSSSGIYCDNCNVWLHRSCADLSLSGYNKLSNISASWRCYTCNSSNQPGSRYHSYEFEVSNPNDVLSHLPCNSTDQDISLDSNFAGLILDKCSTPVSNSRSQPNTANSQSQTFNMSMSSFSDRESSRSSRGSRPPEHSPYGPKTTNPNNCLSVTINCSGVSGKRAELANLVPYTDPDVLVHTETKLDHTVHPSEFLAECYSCAARKDINRSGGGFMPAFKPHYSAEEIALDDNDAETTWASVLVNKCQKLVIGVFYSQPDHRTHQVEQLEKALFQITTKFKNNPNTTFMLSGDFNTGDINWDQGTISPISNPKAVIDLVLCISQQFELTQLQCEPTRLDNLLDLFFTNKPTLLKSVTAIPGISDHEIVLADCDIKPTINKRAPRYIHQRRKPDWEKLKSETVAFGSKFLEESSSRSVSEN